MEFVNAMVGIYTMLYAIERINHAEYVVCIDVYHFNTPPTNMRTAKNFSVLKYLSANWPAIKGAAMAPIEPANPRIMPICGPVKPSPPSAIGADKKRAVTGSHAPQSAYWRNIMAPKREFFVIVVSVVV